MQKGKHREDRWNTQYGRKMNKDLNCCDIYFFWFILFFASF